VQRGGMVAERERLPEESVAGRELAQTRVR
jgi:hypothetical protein